MPAITRKARLLLVLLLATACVTGRAWAASRVPIIYQSPALAALHEQESRRQELLNVLLSQEMKDHLTNFEAKHNERYRWEYYTACLAKGVHVDQANHYFATHQDIGNALPEWQQIELTRTYLAFRTGQLSDAARRNIERILKMYKSKLDDPGVGADVFAPYENPGSQEEFGHGARKRLPECFSDAVQERAVLQG